MSILSIPAYKLSCVHLVKFCGFICFLVAALPRCVNLWLHVFELQDLDAMYYIRN
jgi:hypothetical protein